MMRADPRSVYRKNRGSDRLYFTTVDTVHVTAWYDDSLGGMEVLRMRNQPPPPPHTSSPEFNHTFLLSILFR